MFYAYVMKPYWPYNICERLGRRLGYQTVATIQVIAAVKCEQFGGQWSGIRAILRGRHGSMSAYLHQCSWRENHGEAE